MIGIKVSGPTLILRNFSECSWSTENNQEYSVTSDCPDLYSKHAATECRLEALVHRSSALLGDNCANILVLQYNIWTVVNAVCMSVIALNPRVETSLELPFPHRFPDR